MRNTCFFSGHRKIPSYAIEQILQNLKSNLEDLIKEGFITFISGGARGFDTMAALTVIELKKEYPRIKLVLALPCKEQAKFWSKNEIDLYNDLLKKADEIVYTSEHYFIGCMHIRNRYMVAKSGFCICYLTKKTGGTAFTVEYALRKGLVVVNVK